MSTGLPTADPRLGEAIDRMIARLSRETGIPLSAGRPLAGRVTLTVECGPGGRYPALGDDESYQLDVDASGARLSAPTVYGALDGIETFLQLVTPSTSGFEVPAVHIEDRPRFAWRGLMLDVSRHWMPVEVVQRNLDAMAAVKLNVFHWHLSDDQGFRVESKRYPAAAAAGLGRPLLHPGRDPRAWWPTRATAASAWCRSSTSPATR